MARIYARKRGKSGSTKPMTPGNFATYKKEEVERLIVKLANDKNQSAKIGLILRDQYGIPSVKAITEKTVNDILLENKLLPEIPDDLFNLLVQAVKLRDHMSKNKKDNTSKRGLELVESKVRRLIKYYIKLKRIPAGYKYDPERAKLIVQTGKL